MGHALEQVSHGLSRVAEVTRRLCPSKRNGRVMLCIIVSLKVLPHFLIEPLKSGHIRLDFGLRLGVARSTLFVQLRLEIEYCFRNNCWLSVRIYRA
jgi:hypothetical protein